jgi:Golgi-body localization protein
MQEVMDRAKKNNTFSYIKVPELELLVSFKTSARVENSKFQVCTLHSLCLTFQTPCLNSSVSFELGPSCFS